MAYDPLHDITPAERLRLVRVRQKKSLRVAADEARLELPEWVPMSREIVRRLEEGLIPIEEANVFQLLALAKVYGVEPASFLSPARADDVATVQSLISGIEGAGDAGGWFPPDGGGGQVGDPRNASFSESYVALELVTAA